MQLGIETVEREKKREREKEKMNGNKCKQIAREEQSVRDGSECFRVEVNPHLLCAQSSKSSHSPPGHWDTVERF